MIRGDIGKEFGIKKFGVAIMEREKIRVKEMIKEVEDESYKYLGILEMDEVKDKEMKGLTAAEYLRELRWLRDRNYTEETQSKQRIPRLFLS